MGNTETDLTKNWVKIMTTQYVICFTYFNKSNRYDKNNKPIKTEFNMDRRLYSDEMVYLHIYVIVYTGQGDSKQ